MEITRFEKKSFYVLLDPLECFKQFGWVIRRPIISTASLSTPVGAFTGTAITKGASLWHNDKIF